MQVAGDGCPARWLSGDAGRGAGGIGDRVTFSALDPALAGTLFATDAMRACFSDDARLHAMLEVEVALARSEKKLGLAPTWLEAVVAAIAPNSLHAAGIGRHTALAGVLTIPFIKAVHVLLPPQLERGFHKGATTQDIIYTALVPQMRAAPLTFGYKVTVWLAGVAEAVELLPDIRQRLPVGSLAGPVGRLAALGEHCPTVLDGFARELGLGTTPIAWHARRGRDTEAGCWLAQLIGSLAIHWTGDAKMTTALLDRRIHPCHIVETGNESFRFKASTAATKRRTHRAKSLTAF